MARDCPASQQDGRPVRRLDEITGPRRRDAPPLVTPRLAGDGAPLAAAGRRPIRQERIGPGIYGGRPVAAADHWPGAHVPVVLEVAENARHW